ncbi:hypothetical protein K7X08_007703 [Anisodus acutangulus]|uniref:Uncharacterized protein n=1 Tax=Anisodus acutangulus TaxID=402998 RepID=A0A9Q1MNY7_9SOLA|nr:hypothetical protein K7X08_007703 [Anisodus acutangulus]
MEAVLADKKRFHPHSSVKSYLAAVDSEDENFNEPSQKHQLVSFMEESIVENVEPLASEEFLAQVHTIEATRKKKSGKATTTVLRQMPMREAKKDKAARKKRLEWSPANERACSASIQNGTIESLVTINQTCDDISSSGGERSDSEEEDYFDSDLVEQTGNDDSDVEIEDYMDEVHEEELERLYV